MNNLLLMLSFLAATNTAFASNDSENLIEGCKQLVSLHESKNNQRTIMQFVMSPSDTLLAGYCKGMIQSFIDYSSTRVYPCGHRNQHYCSERICNKSNWFSVAMSISQYDSAEEVDDNNGNSQNDIEDILIGGCR